MSSGKKITQVLAMDCETSGLNWKSGHSECNQNVAEGYQAIEWGMIAANVSDYKPTDAMHVLIKWNGESKWDPGAEKVHGKSKEFLEKHGVDEEEAVIQIVEFIIKNFDINKPIFVLGHNVGTFDLPFLKDLLYRYGIEKIKFGHRCFDTFSASMATLKEHDSDALFKTLGFPDRGNHSALEDANNALSSFRMINKAWTQMLKNA